MKYAVLFGFRKSDIDDVGYVSVTPSGLSVVKDAADAKRFSLSGDAFPEKWRDFFNSELPDWKFHVVRMQDPPGEEAPAAVVL